MSKKGAERMKKFIQSILLLTVFFLVEACSYTESPSQKNLIYEETISPNEKYVSSQEDIVYYTIQFFQDSDYTITVNSESNFALFKPAQYSIEYDQPVSKENIEIQWTTLMGSTEASEDDELTTAHISLSSNDEIFSERSINFINGALETIIDAIDSKK